MLKTIFQFKWHLLAFLALVILHGSIHSAESTLPLDVTKALAKADNDVDQIQAKAEGEKFKVRKALLVILTKAQDKVLKAGDLDGANAIKTKIAEIDKLTGPADLLAVDTPSVRERLTGSFTYEFHSGHRGILQVKKNEATIPGFTGNAAPEGSTVAITWSNGSKWVVSDQAGELVATASDGTAKLIQVK